jgi:putative cell wall-binding protein
MEDSKSSPLTGMIVLAIAALVLALLPTPALAEERPVTRIAGSDRISTAIAVSQQGWDVSETVVLATGSDYPDALAGGALAGALDAPLLLTWPTQLPAAVEGELRRLTPSRVVLIGGSSAISGEVERQVGEIAPVERLSGPDHFATAAGVARRVATEAQARGASIDEVVVASGTSFPDALSAASLYAVEGRQPPVVLTAAQTIPAETAGILDELPALRAVVIGGTVVISPGVETEIRDLHGLEVTRLSGADRFATSVSVATEALRRMGAQGRSLTVATGGQFADALPAGALAARRGGPLLLVPRDSLTDELKGFASTQRERFTQAEVVGGGAAVSEASSDQIRAALNEEPPVSEEPPASEDPPPPPPPAEDGSGTRDDPHPVGELATVDGVWQLSVRSSVPRADTIVQEENQFNDPPREGHQFFMARVRVTYQGAGSGRFGGGYSLRALGPQNVSYSSFEDSCGVIPDDLSNRRFFPGGTIEGNVCWEIRSSDADDLLMFQRPSSRDHTDTFYRLHGEAPDEPFPTPPPPSGAQAGSRGAPHAFGTDVPLHDGWVLTVLDSDPDATDRVLAENQFNDPPAEGQQFFMARVRLTYEGAGTDRAGDFRLRSVGHAGAIAYSTFEDSCGVIPDRVSSREVHTGGTIEGNVCWEVRSADAPTLTLFDDPLGARDGYEAFLALQR